MQTDLLEIMCSMYQVQGIQVLSLSKDDHGNYNDLHNIDYGFRKKMFEGYDYNPFISKIGSLISPKTIYQLEDDFKLHYFCLKLPEHLYKGSEPCILMIGPILFQPMGTNTFQNLMEHKNIPLEFHWEVQEFYNRIPIVPSYDTWYNTLFFFLSRIFGESLELRMVPYGEMELFKDSYEDYHISPAPEVGQSSLEDRYAKEAAMLQAVSIGDIKSAMEFHNQFRQYKILPRTPDPVRNEKNLLITLNTLLRKAVQMGGVHPLHVDNLSRQFAILIESASTPAQIKPIPPSMLRKYCMLVKNYSRNAYSGLVQNCMNYIDFHYMDDLSLDFIAKMCSVSNSYLSALFKKETGMTLTDYINSTRVRRSLTLLNTTSLSIKEIASLCGFSDSNYYTRTFKKFHGKSPKQYRNEIRNT